MNTTFAPTTRTAAYVPVVERVETLIVDLPTIRPHKLSDATMNGQTLMLVKVHCSDGVVGIGEGTTIGGLGSKSFLTCGSNILFALGFMIDCNVVGGNWIELPAGKYSKATCIMSYIAG